jgi:hypothetical protein
MAQFFSVQSLGDAARLAAGGAPWPTGLQRSNLGLGLYAWETLAEAEAYRQLLTTHGAAGLLILTYVVSDADMAGLTTLDLTFLSDDDVNAWMALYSCYGQGQCHGLEHVIRQTNHGKEHYFAASVFGKLTVIP